MSAHPLFRAGLFSGKAAVVSGGGTGLGLQIVFTEFGAAVVDVSSSNRGFARQDLRVVWVWVKGQTVVWVSDKTWVRLSTCGYTIGVNMP